MFRPKYPDIVKPEYEAICGFHVRYLFCKPYTVYYIIFISLPKVASAIAILGLLGLIFSIPAAIIKLSIIRLAMALIFGLFYAGILYADKYERPWAYVPFLIVYGATLILGIVVIILSLIFILFPPEAFKNFINDEEEKGGEEEHGFKFNQTTINLLLTVIIISGIIGELIGLYIWNVIRRARKYMLDEVCSGKVERNFTTLESGNPSIEFKV
uniref:Uncharacterized protein n=1 Tax=Panagrolaimus superbus TaxID=310955 RepID=A0A914YWB3_9BILA